jgi:hypothetical protein
LWPLFSGLKLTILDVQSIAETKKSQLFHDRYVLVYGAEAELRSGYNLSNSFQGATKNTPLLITPIPPDVLDDVGAYVAQLQAAVQDAVGPATVVPLFSITAFREERHRSTTRLSIPNKGTFFAKLLTRPQYAQLDEDSLELALREAGLTDGTGRYLLAQGTAARLPAYLSEISNEDSQNFADSWWALALWIYQLHDPEQVVRHALDGEPRLFPRLREFLELAPGRKPPSGTRELSAGNDIFRLATLFFGNFESAIEAVQNIAEHVRPDYSGERYPFRLALNMLAASASQQFVAALDALAASVPETGRRYSNSPDSIAVAPILDLVPEVVVEQESAPLTHAMMCSATPFVRALGAYLAVSRSRAPLSAERLPGLSAWEQTRTLAEIVYGARIDTNRAGDVDRDEVRGRRLAAFNEIIRLWPEKIGDDELRTIALRSGGPIPGSWAGSTTAELLSPLVTAGKLNWDRVLLLWGSLMFEHLESLSKESEGHMFYAHGDASLSDTVAWAFSQATSEARAKWWSRLVHLAEKFARRFDVPFARSTRYSFWSQGREGLEWIWCIAALIQIHGQGSITDVEAYAAKAREWAATLASAPVAHNESLLQFVRDLSAKLQTQGERVVPIATPEP